ncbi:MAG: hypothetical protein RMM28_01590, partial [Thermoleophilia bacterium]|nr:hypothetical protein [Thermoleophilia bacterium]
PSPTPDERLVAELQTVVEAAGSARRALSSGREPAAASDPLRRALAALESARVVAPRAGGALENRSMRAALRQGRTLVRGASADVSRGRAAAAAAKLAQTLTLARVALREFGRPLRREFVATAVHRSFPNIPAYRDYSGVTASTSEEVVEIVIGRATRATANAGEGARAVPAAPGLPVTELSAYQIQDPIGRYTTNWCALDAGLITCPLRPTLTRDHLFTLAFAPKLPRGMQVLVRFRAASGRSSYSVYTAR